MVPFKSWYAHIGTRFHKTHLLLWLAARCRPVLAAAGAFIVTLTIVWTTTFSIGMFKGENFPIAERTLAAQAAILA